jgi:hypothetical protein
MINKINLKIKNFYLQKNAYKMNYVFIMRLTFLILLSVFQDLNCEDIKLKCWTECAGPNCDNNCVQKTLCIPGVISRELGSCLWCRNTWNDDCKEFGIGTKYECCEVIKN